MSDAKTLNLDDLDHVSGGTAMPSESWTQAVVSGITNYLALRTQPLFDQSCEDGQLHEGDAIEIRPDIRSGGFVYARALGRQGWVEEKYVNSGKA